MIWLLGGYMWLFVHRPFEFWPSLGTLQVERVYMLIMLVVWLVSPKKGLMPNRVHLALAFFSIALTVAWVASPYADQPGCQEVVENVFKVAVFYVLVVTTVRDEKDLRRLVLLFLGAVGLYMAHSTLEFVNGRYQWRMGIRRMIGVDTTFGDPNAFASTLLYALPFLLPFWFERPRRVPRWLLGGYALAACGCILLTGSRAGLVGLAGLAGMVLLLSVRRKAPAVLLGGLAALAGLAVLTVALPEELQHRYLTLVDSSQGPRNAEESVKGRIDGIVLGFELFQRSPLLGHGPSSFVHATGKGLQPHNLYGQVLSETGAVGALALLTLVACYAWNWAETRRLYRTHPALRPADRTRDGSPPAPADLPYLVARSVFLTVVLMLVMGCAGHNLYRYNWQWFAAFGAIALHCARTRVAAYDSHRAFALPFNPRPRLRARPAAGG